MYTMGTPFSGLSLIIHLLIIAVSSVVSSVMLLWKKDEEHAFVAVPAVADTYLRRRLKYGLSVFIMVLLFGIMLTSFIMVLATGARAGSSEPQVQYIRNEYRYIRTVHIDPARAAVKTWYDEYQVWKLENAKAKSDIYYYNAPVVIRAGSSHK